MYKNSEIEINISKILACQSIKIEEFIKIFSVVYLFFDNFNLEKNINYYSQILSNCKNNYSLLFLNEDNKNKVLDFCTDKRNEDIIIGLINFFYKIKEKLKVFKKESNENNSYSFQEFICLFSILKKIKENNEFYDFSKWNESSEKEKIIIFYANKINSCALELLHKNNGKEFKSIQSIFKKTSGNKAILESLNKLKS